MMKCAWFVAAAVALAPVGVSAEVENGDDGRPRNQRDERSEKPGMGLPGDYGMPDCGDCRGGEVAGGGDFDGAGCVPPEGMKDSCWVEGQECPPNCCTRRCALPPEPGLAGDPRIMDLRVREMQDRHRFEQAKRNIEIQMANLELEKTRRGLQRAGGPHHKLMFAKCVVFMVFCALIHVLLAGWAYRDIRTRNSGSGLWIVVILLTGFLGAFLYALVRLGDIRAGRTP